MKSLIWGLFLLALSLFYPPKSQAYVVNCSSGGTLTMDNLSEKDTETIKKIQESQLCTENKDPFVCRLENPKPIETTCKEGRSNEGYPITICEGKDERKGLRCRQDQGITVCEKDIHVDNCQLAKWEMQYKVLNAIRTAIPTPTPTVVLLPTKIQTTILTATPILTPEPINDIQPETEKVERLNFFQMIFTFFANFLNRKA